MTPEWQAKREAVLAALRNAGGHEDLIRMLLDEVYLFGITSARTK